MRIWIVALVIALGAVARAAPPSARVVLVDPDPELRRAVTTALAPWRLEVITDPNPIDAATAPARADAMSARFVVWREGKTLVVFDRARGETLRRDGTGGPLDEVAAASAALTIKTLMRLPDQPDQIDRTPDRTGPTKAPQHTGTEIRVQAGFATRVAFGSQTAIGGRFLGGVGIRPIASSGWRFGLLGDLGTSDAVSKAGFKGQWSDWALLIVASYTITRGKLEIEPYLAAGVTRSTLDGTEMADRRVEHDTLPAIRGGGWVRRRVGMWTVAGTVEVGGVAGTPTYTRINNRQAIFTVPSVGLSVGLAIAADLGR